MIRRITLIFIALYPIMPDYFRILGLPSGAVVACIFVILSCISGRNMLIVRKKDAIIATAVTMIICIPYIYHGEYTTAIKCVVEYFLVFLALCRYFCTKERIIEALDIVVTIATLTCVFGLFDFCTGKSLLWCFYNGTTTDLTPALQIRGVFARSEAMFGHAITYAVYLSMCALIDSVFIFETKKRKYKVYYCILTLTLFTTMSRAPIILFIIGQLLLTYMFGFTKFIKTLAKAGVGLALGLVFISSIFPNAFSIMQYMWNLLLALFSEDAALQIGNIQNANPFEYRLELLKIIPKYIQESWFLGRGASLSFTFEILGHTYYSIDNAYLVWMFKYGLIGLLGNMVYFFYLAVMGLKQRKHTDIFKMFLVIDIVYILNLFSVAQMSEYKLWIVLFTIAYNLYRVNKTESRIK